MKTAIEAEIAARLAMGCEQLSVAEMGARFQALGYKLDRSLDCRHVARIMSGKRAGESYPAISTGVREADSGLSAFNVDARRDDNFRAMQKLRQDIFAVTRGAILEA